MSRPATADHETTRADEHLDGCPAALSIPGAHEDCRCSELAALFGVSTRAECFGRPDPARAHERWKAARAEAAASHRKLMRELRADEQAALARLRDTARGEEALERDIRTARRLLAQERAQSAPRRRQ